MMFETIATEVVLSFAIVGASAMAIAGTWAALRATRVSEATVNVEPAVRKAPYHRLHNILPRDGR